MFFGLESPSPSVDQHFHKEVPEGRRAKGRMESVEEDRKRMGRIYIL
jgi:hypothetical protein